MKLDHAIIRTFERVFVVSLIGKATNGLVELVLGVVLLVTSSARLQQFASFITSRELREDPADSIAMTIIHIGGAIGAAQNFVALYLLIHGIVKLALAYFLVKKIVAAYPWAILTLVLFMIYQATLVIHSFSLLAFLLTVLDFIIVVLALVEYRLLKRPRETDTAAVTASGDDSSVVAD